MDPNAFLGSKYIASEALADEPAQALLDAKRMVLLYPHSAPIRLLYGQLLARKGDLQQAAIEIEKAIEQNPEDEIAYLSLIEIYDRSGAYEVAIRKNKQLLKMNPGSIPGLVYITKLHLINGPKKSALKYAKKAFELQSNNPELILLYALALEANKKSAEAVNLYELLYRLNPSNDELMNRMVGIYRQLGDLSEALSVLEELTVSGGQLKPGLAMQKAFILWELGRITDAEEVLEPFARDLPDSKRIIYMLAMTKEKLRKFVEALDLYRNVFGEEKLELAAKVRTAFILKELGKLAEAENTLQEIVSRPNSDWEIFALLAGIQSDMDHYDSAIETLESGYKKFPQKHRFLFLIGVNQEKSGARAECLKTMRRVIKVDPENSAAFNFLGYLYAESGENLNEAEELLKQALKLKPKDGYYLDSLGWVYFQKGDLVKAEKMLKEAIQIVPGEGVILEHLGELYLKKGDKERAIEYFEKSLKSNLDVRDKKRIERRFLELRGNA